MLLKISSVFARGPKSVRARRLMITLAVAACLGTSTAMAHANTFTVASLTDPTNNAGSGLLAFSHSYPSNTCSLSIVSGTSIACPGSIAPTVPTPATGTTSINDSVTNNGTLSTSQMTERVSAPSCATVQYANAKATRPMLPRFNTTFNVTDPWGGTNATTLDGSTAYAASVAQQQQSIPLVGLGVQYGYGIWFKVASGTAGAPLFSFSASPANDGSVNADRILYMNSSGRLVYIANNAGTSITQGTGISGVPNDLRGTGWHFAYVRTTITNVLVVGVSLGATMYIDGIQVATASSLLSGASSYQGYWHMGWAPTGKTGLASANGSASLSNMVVFEPATAPAAPTSTQLSSQSNFSTWATSANEQWVFGDNGTTTYTGTQPVITTTSPCSTITIAWAFTNPAGTATATTQLSAFANGTTHTVPAPNPGITQTSTVTTARHSSYASYATYLPGLHLYAPLTFQVLTNPASTWSLTFTWPSAYAVFIA